MNLKFNVVKTISITFQRNDIWNGQYKQIHELLIFYRNFWSRSGTLCTIESTELVRVTEKS